MVKPFSEQSLTSENTKERVAVITGASRRLGLYLVKALLDDGWTVHAITRKTSSSLHELNQKFGQKGDAKKLHLHSFENSDRINSEEVGYCEKNVNLALAAILAESKRIHLLVNNASVFDNDRAVDVGGMGVYSKMVFMHMLLPAIMCQGLSHALFDEDLPGNIVSITDIYAHNPNQDFSLYCSTKAGLESLNKSFAKKYAPGIRVNAIQPGPIKFLPEHDDDHKSKVIAETLLPYEGGFLPIHQTLELILANHYLTGVSIPVDGGRSLVRG